MQPRISENRVLNHVLGFCPYAEQGVIYIYISDLTQQIEFDPLPTWKKQRDGSYHILGDDPFTSFARDHRAALLNAITSTLRVKEVKSRKSEVACVHARQHALIAELLEIALRNEHTTLAIWH